MAKKEKLPRGLTYRGNSIIASFALPDGTIARRAVGVKDVTSTQECTRRRLEFVRQVDNGTYAPWQKRQAPPKKVTVADLWPIYLRNYQNKGKTDAGRLEIAWNHLKPKFATLAVEDVSTALIETYIESRRAAGMQNGTINRELATLRAMLIRGTKVTPRLVTMVPAFPDRLKEAAPRKGFIGNPEYKILAANAKDLWLRSLIACCYSFGFRKSELLNLRCGQVDLFDRLIRLDAEDVKNNEARDVPMTSEVFQLLSECVRGKQAEDYVFTREPAGSHVVDPREEWYSLCVSSGLGRFEPAKRKNGEEYNRYVGLNLHDFRRSAIRNMTRRGVQTTVAMKISGHKTASVFRRYNITDNPDLADAARKIEAGSQVSVPGSKTDTKSDTVTFGHA
jgi:integrase